MKDLIYLKNVASLHMDIARCTGCGMCREVCPHDVFVMNGKTAAIARRDACMECGACSRDCPAGALSVSAGVGCAAAVLNGLLGRSGGECCCGPAEDGGKTGCC